MMLHDVSPQLTPKLVVAIIDRDEAPRLKRILSEKHIYFQYMMSAKGTASSEVLEAFGLSATEKVVCLCILPSVKVSSTVRTINDRLELVKPGNGIVFVLPISGATGVIANAFQEEQAVKRQKLERLDELMEKEMQGIEETTRYELIVSMINQGFSEVLMDAAKKAGARGGTIIHARRTGLEDAVKFFGVSLQEEKEVVSIIVPKCQKKELMQAIGKVCGIKTPARGIVFSMPVDYLCGLEPGECDEENE